MRDQLFWAKLVIIKQTQAGLKVVVVVVAVDDVVVVVIIIAINFFS